MITLNKIYKGATVLALGLTLGMTTSCNDFIEVQPTGVLNEDLAYSEPEKMVNAAYATLGDCWYTYPFNLWPFGDMASDDCFKGGSGVNDTNWQPVEVFSTLTSSNPDHSDELWYRIYVAISRCNRALIACEQDEDTNWVDRIAEVKFIRAHFYFKLWELYYRVPWIDEEVVLNDSHESVKNDLSHDELLQKIIDDFENAYNVLPKGAPGKDGRVNKEAAAAYLAKCYLYRAYGDGYESGTGYSHVNTEYMKKVIEYTDEVVGNTSFGYLDDFGDIFLPACKNSKESVFAVQTSNYTEDNTTKGRANWSNCLNGCWGMWSKGWDFHKPSQNLVNAFKVGDDGLPMFDTYESEHNSYPINGIESTQKYDPRLFHTVAMPSFPYKYETGSSEDGLVDDLTMTTKNSRNPSTYGYYSSLKDVPQRKSGETFVESTWQSFAQNDYIFRYSDIMLMRAEAMIETGDNAGAVKIINAIRQRANNSVQKHISYAKNYVATLGMYTDSQFANKDYARQALRWERRVEMAMESSRFFDLRRWGMLSTTMNKYFQTEVQDNYEGQTYAQYLQEAHFTAGKNEYFPIPYNQMFYVPGLYEQNAGY